jgi:hypothetical protein
MAERNIVGGMFGISPEMYTMARDIAGQQQAASVAQPGTLMSPSLAPLYAQAAQQGQLIGRGVGGLLGVEDPELMKIRDVQQMRTQFDVSTPKGLSDFAQALGQKGYTDLAMQAAQRAAELEQTIATTGLRRAQADKAASGTAVSPEQLLTSGRYTPASIAKYQASENIADLVLSKEATGGGDGVGKLTPAQRAADTAFGKEYNDFVAGGGITTIQKNLADLDKAIDALEKSPQGDITGKLIGLSDKAGTLSFTNPKAAEIKDIVGGVVQSNLRAVLGGQFAQKEGEALLARAYNPSQPQKDNLNRLKALRQQIANTGQAKLQAVAEFEEKGTLKDFKASNVRAAQIEDTKKKKTTKTLKSGVTVEIEE